MQVVRCIRSRRNMDGWGTSIRKSNRMLGNQEVDVKACPRQGRMHGGGLRGNMTHPERQASGPDSHLIPIPVTWGMTLPWCGVARKSRGPSWGQARAGPLQDAASTERAGGKAKFGEPGELQA